MSRAIKQTEPLMVELELSLPEKAGRALARCHADNIGRGAGPGQNLRRSARVSL